MFPKVNLTDFYNLAPVRRKWRKKYILGGLLGVVIILIILQRRSLTESTLSSHASSILKSRDFIGFLVDTQACKIPNIDPFDPLVRNFIRLTGPMECHGKASVTYQDGVKLKVNRTAVKLYYRNDFKYCKYQAITRPYNESDFKFGYRVDGVAFSDEIVMKDEFIRVYCYSTSDGIINVNFHSFVIPKPHVNKRCNKNLKKHKKKKNRPKEILNVAMIGIDSVSRINMLRQMRKTRRFLIDELEAVDLKGYNKVADNTFVNIVPMTVGKFVEELPWNETMSDTPFDNYDFIWKNYSNSGYRTLYAEDFPEIAIFVYLKAGFHKQPADYYNRPFSLALEKQRTIWNTEHHCVNDRLETDIVLNYVHQFSDLFSDKPNFSFTFITRLTHDYINRAGAADTPHYNFLKSMRDKGHLNNTVLFFYSDHGIRFGEIRSSFIGKVEERLPFMYVVFPKWFHKKYPQHSRNLYKNQNRLTTPFDIYETLKDILHFNGEVRKAKTSERGISLFNEIPEERSCDNAGVLPHWCMCSLHKRIPNDDPFVIELSHVLVQFMNNQISQFSVCATLKFLEVFAASKIIPSDQVLRFEQSLHDVINRTVRFGEKVKAFVDYQVTVKTAPGDALFESTIRYNPESPKDKFVVMGEISRINKYGSHGDCMEQVQLRKYCYCGG